ncbi:squalene/phytoene synthase family protein [Hyphomonas sp.]|uniref:squalene/phytoene synthase family protein n=1 Tax=Hyphomonas sp. TaxID=87 RepID=UPI0025C4627C|nr:squalene/phytoene synthase family protein [Hyphomonas sp.]
MSNETRPLTKTPWAEIDKRVRRVDEDRWISSRFAPASQRRALTALYALNYELVRVQEVVSEETLGLIRFQWWREAINEIETTGNPRGHDVCLAIAEEVAAGRLKTGALQKLVDGYQTAFVEQDRSKEPEAWIALTAANILIPVHNWAEEIRGVSAAYAAVRRKAGHAFGPHVTPAPKPLRPAVAHFRLRKLYCEGRSPNPVAKRFSIMKAMNTGEV